MEHRIVEKSQARPAVDCGETALGEVMDEIVVENAFGGKPGSHGSKLIHSRWRHHYSLSLPTCQYWQLNNREERRALQAPDAGNTRVGPQPGGPFVCLTCQATEKQFSQENSLSD